MRRRSRPGQAHRSSTGGRRARWLSTNPILEKTISPRRHTDRLLAKRAGPGAGPGPRHHRRRLPVGDACCRCWSRTSPSTPWTGAGAARAATPRATRSRTRPPMSRRWWTRSPTPAADRSTVLATPTAHSARWRRRALTAGIRRMVLYEPALGAVTPPEFADQMAELLAQGRPEDVVIGVLRDLAGMSARAGGAARCRCPRGRTGSRRRTPSSARPAPKTHTTLPRSGSPR